MNSTNQSQFGNGHERKGRSPLAFRFGRTPQKTVEKPSPFTEVPAELKRSRFSLGRLLRGLVNTVLLIILFASLLALIAAFAYQMMTDPEMLAQASYNLVDTMQDFLQSILGAG